MCSTFFRLRSFVENRLAIPAQSRMFITTDKGRLSGIKMTRKRMAKKEVQDALWKVEPVRSVDKEELVAEIVDMLRGIASRIEAAELVAHSDRAMPESARNPGVWWRQVAWRDERTRPLQAIDPSSCSPQRESHGHPHPRGARLAPSSPI
jgi:hypothetical protein